MRIVLFFISVLIEYRNDLFEKPDSGFYFRVCPDTSLETLITYAIISVNTPQHDLAVPRFL